MQWTSTPARADRALVGKDFDLAEGEDVGGVDGPRTTKEGPDAGGQLLGHEGLGDVVVGAGLEPGHHVVGVVAGRDHDHRHRTGPAELPAALEAVDAGQHQVDEDDIGRLVGEALEPDLTGAGLVDLVALVLEGQAHRGADALVVLHEEDSVAHGRRFIGYWSQQVLQPGRRSRSGLLDEDQVDFQIWGVQIVPTIMPYALPPAGVVGLFQFCTFELAITAQVARSCQM